MKISDKIADEFTYDAEHLKIVFYLNILCWQQCEEKVGKNTVTAMVYLPLKISISLNGCE